MRYSKQFIETGSFPNNDEKFKQLEGEQDLHEIKGHQLRLLGCFFNGHFYIVKCIIKKGFKLTSPVVDAARENWKLCKKELENGI